MLVLDELFELVLDELLDDVFDEVFELVFDEVLDELLVEVFELVLDDELELVFDTVSSCSSAANAPIPTTPTDAGWTVAEAAVVITVMAPAASVLAVMNFFMVCLHPLRCPPRPVTRGAPRSVRRPSGLSLAG